MKKTLILAASIMLLSNMSLALNTAFDTTSSATEVKLKPAQNVTTSTKSASSTLQDEKYNSALANLEDAQVELRQELADANQRLLQAKGEKEVSYEKYKSAKKEVKSLNKKMKNIETTKKYINKNLESTI